jgi:hypothetical protein
MRVGLSYRVPPAAISRAIASRALYATGKVSRAHDLIASPACDCWGVLLHVASGIARGFIGRQPVTNSNRNAAYSQHISLRSCSRRYHLFCASVREGLFVNTGIR